MTEYDLGKVVGDDGATGADGSTLWYTSTAPSYANSKYTFTISNLSGKAGLDISVNDIVFYSTYYYIVSTVNTTTVDCATRVSIKGSDASVTVVDNLTSDSSTSVLSAKQGKVLNTNKIETSAIATSFGSTTSDSKVPSEKLIKTELDKKIATSNTAGLVKNDGTIDTNSYITSSSLPTKTSDLTNDGSSSSDSLVYVETSATSGLLKNDGTIDTNSYSTTSHSHNQITSDGKITSTAVTVASGDNIVITDYSDSSKIKRVANILASHVKDSSAHTNIGSSANATQETINTSIDTALSGKQATLVSGTNIKTVNNESLLGSGNITIQGGSSVDIVTSWESTPSDSKVASEKLTKDSLDDKISKSNTSGLVKNDGTIDTTSYSTFSGSYSDLSNKPSIPASSSDLSDGSDLVKTSSTTGLIKNDGSIDTTTYLSSLPSHTHGNLTNDGKVGSNANYIVVTTTGGAITSVQKLGNITYDGKIGSTSGKPVITTTSGTVTTGSFGSTAGTFAEGNHTHSGYISTSSTTGLVKNDGSIMTSGTGSTNYAAGNHTHSGMLTSSDIADNLTTNDSTKVLSAKQGKVLNDLIGAAITYINQ